MYVCMAVVLSTVALHACMAIFDIGRSLVCVFIHVCCTSKCDSYSYLHMHTHTLMAFVSHVAFTKCQYILYIVQGRIFNYNEM